MEASPSVEPNRHVVMIITTYETFGGPEEAEEQVSDSYSHYDTKHVVVAADSLDNLPHAQQISNIRETLGLPE